MPAQRPTDGVDLDRLERLLIILSLLSFGLVVLGLIGEYRGWWNDIGEVLIGFGTVAGVATGVVALLVNSTKVQARRFADGVEGNGDKLDRIHDDHGDKLDAQSQKLDRQHDVLVQIRDRL